MSLSPDMGSLTLDTPSTCNTPSTLESLSVNVDHPIDVTHLIDGLEDMEPEQGARRASAMIVQLFSTGEGEPCVCCGKK